MLAASTGRGTTGIGENFAKTRLLLAKRAGYIPQNTRTPPGVGAASDMWRSVSKNLNRDARAAGYAHPNQFLRQGIMNGGIVPRSMVRGGTPRTPSAVYYASQMAQTPTAGNPFQNLLQLAPLPQLQPRMPMFLGGY